MWLFSRKNLVMINPARDFNRFLFRDEAPQQRYNYQRLNASENQDSVIDTGTVDIPNAPYNADGKGVSFELFQALNSALSRPEKEVRNCLYEMLHAMDEELTANPVDGITNGLDGLGAYLKANNFTKFSIKNGFIVFNSADGANSLRLPVVSSRQQELKDSYAARAAEAAAATSSEGVDVATDAQSEKAARLRAELAEARKNVEKLPPPNDEIAVEVPLPKVVKEHPYAVPKSYWISNNPPVVLTGEDAEGVNCKMHVSAMLKREIGPQALAKLGYKEGEGHGAWSFKYELLSAGGGEEIAATTTRLSLKDGAVVLSEDTSKYVEDLKKFKADLDKVDMAKYPVVMGMHYRGSHYKEESSKFNASVAPEYQSFNTHLAYCLGKGWRGLGYEWGLNPTAGQEATNFVTKTLSNGLAEKGKGMNPEFLGMLEGTRIAVDGEICDFKDGAYRHADGSFIRLEPTSYVEFEDYYFSEHINGKSLVTPFTRYISADYYIPTGAIRLKTETLEVDPSEPWIPKEEALRPAKTFTLKRGERISKAFAEQVSQDPQDWQLFLSYLRIKGVDSKFIPANTPIGVPDMEVFGKYLKQMTFAGLPDSTVEDPALAPASVFYLKEGENIRDVYRRDISSSEKDWALLELYFELINFRPETVKYDTDPVPVPNMDAFRKYIADKGGLGQLEYAKVAGKCEKYNKEHPTEHLLAIDGKKTPWEMVESFFATMNPPLTKKEKDYVLEQMDLLNKTIDLRMQDFPYIMKDGEVVVNGKGYAKWDVGNYFWISDKVIADITYNIERKRILNRSLIPDVLKNKDQIEIEIPEHMRDVIAKSTDDPKIQRLMMLALLNEQLGGGYRKKVLEHAVPDFMKDSLGLFRVRPVPEDMNYLSKEFGFTFKDFDAYKEQLVQDDYLNGIVAAHRFKQSTNSYRHLLAVNNEEVSQDDPYFITCVLSSYNRPSSNIYAGMFGIMARDISSAFGLGLDITSFEKPHILRGIAGLPYNSHTPLQPILDEFGKPGLPVLPPITRIRMPGIIPDIDIPDIDLTNNPLMPADKSEKIYGADVQGITEYWNNVAKKLIDTGAISYTPDQMNSDFKLVSGSVAPSAYDLNPSFYISSLVRTNKESFLKSSLYKAINEAYTARTGSGLSLLIKDADYQDTAVQNYGYGAAIISRALQSINSYSESANLQYAKENGYGEAREIRP